MSNSLTDFDSNSVHGNIARETPHGQRGSESVEQKPYSGDSPAKDWPGLGEPAKREDGAPFPGGGRE
jgi:hypothetical protein